jgi:ABC-2 type transport system permease protein
MATINAEIETRVGGWRKFFVDLHYLLLEQLLEIRLTWYWHVIFALVLPMALVFGFGRIGSGVKDRESLLYIITGSAIFSVANDGLYVLATRIAVMRKEGILVYYASLPISRFALMTALIFSRLVITLPGMLVPILFGSMIYQVQFTFSPWILLLLPLIGLSMSAIGMALGSLVENLEVMQVLANILLFVLIMAAPVFIPLQALPLPLQILGYALPPTYAAVALRMALNGMITGSFYVNVAVLAAMMVVSFLALNRWLKWRVG